MSTGNRILRSFRTRKEAEKYAVTKLLLIIHGGEFTDDDEGTEVTSIALPSICFHIQYDQRNCIGRTCWTRMASICKKIYHNYEGLVAILDRINDRNPKEFGMNV